MQLRSLTLKTLGPLLTNSAWCRQCGKPLRATLQSLYSQRRSMRWWKRVQAKVFPCSSPLHYFSLSLSLTLSISPPLLLVTTHSLCSHWCFLRLSLFSHLLIFYEYFFCRNNSVIVFLKPVCQIHSFNIFEVTLCCLGRILSYYVQSAYYEPAATMLQWCNLYLLKYHIGTLAAHPASSSSSSRTSAVTLKLAFYFAFLLLTKYLFLEACGLLLKVVLQVNFWFDSACLQR